MKNKQAIIMIANELAGCPTNKVCEEMIDEFGAVSHCFNIGDLVEIVKEEGRLFGNQVLLIRRLDSEITQYVYASMLWIEE